jgi:hypothetical protein
MTSVGKIAIFYLTTTLQIPKYNGIIDEDLWPIEEY